MLPPLQLQYDAPLDTSYSDVVTNRVRTVINHPKAVFTPGERIAFVLNSTSFVDLKSVKLQAVVHHEFINSNQHEDMHEYSLFPQYTPYLFENIILKTTGGVVLEQIEQAQCVAHIRDLISRRIVDNETQSSSYLSNTSVYHEERSQRDYFRSSSTSTGILVTLSAYDLLGFFNMNKVLRMSTLGGLIIEFLLAPPLQVVQFKGDRDLNQNFCPNNFTYRLTDVQTVYDEVEVTDAFMSNYLKKYERNGFTLEFMSVTNTRDHVQGLKGLKVIPINRSLERCKYIISVARPANLITDSILTRYHSNSPEVMIINSYNNFLAPATNDFSFQYKLSGELLPRRRVSNFLMGYNEFEKIVQSDVTRRQRNNLSFENYKNNLILRSSTAWKSITAYRFNSTANNKTEAVFNSNTNNYQNVSLDVLMQDLETWTNFAITGTYQENKSFYIQTFKGRKIFRAVILPNTPSASLNMQQLFYYEDDGSGTNTFVLKRPSYFLRIYFDGLPDEFFQLPNTLNQTFYNDIYFNGPVINDSNNQPLPNTGWITSFTIRYVYPDKERFANVGSFLMAITLNSVDTLTSTNTKPIDSSSAYLEFDLNSSYTDAGTNNQNRYITESICVDTFLYHFTTLRVRDGVVEISR